MAVFQSIFVIFIIQFCWFLIEAQQFRLANIYADDMVLQVAPKRAQIWGWGDSGTLVSVHLGVEEFLTTVQIDGKWSVRLSPQMAGGPYQLNINHGGNESITINVWFGDIWVCSGQSNMEMSISVAFNATEETEKAITYKNLRLMQLYNSISDVELEEIDSISIPWSVPTYQNVPEFSAVCLMFGERMSDSLGGRPIGLIDTTWGGTRIEAWSSSRVTEYCNTPLNNGNGDQNDDHVLWNSMIKPLTNLAIRGVIWYQGESNAEWQSEYYACHIQRLAADWKNTFVDGNVIVLSENGIAFPFGVVQLGPKSEVGEYAFGYLRWHQTVDQGIQPNIYMPESFMAAAYDTTDPDSPLGDNHPRDKQTVAQRLANAGKALLYRENWHMNGPVVLSTSETIDGVLTLTYNMDIIVLSTKGFSIRRSDGIWVETTIAGSLGRDVHVNIESGATHLAYAWRRIVCDYKMCSIYSDDEEALPAQVWLWNLALNKSGLMYDIL